MRFLLVVTLALTAACSSSPGTEPPVPEEITGVITEIERDDAGGITAFMVSADEGSTHDIRIDPARDYGFDLEHLVEHQTTGDPVIVTTEKRDGTAYAVEILDA